MKLAMTMTATKRPEYLEHVLVSLANNQKINDYTLHFGIEPISQEVVDVCRNCSFIKTELTVNPQVFGVRKNPFETLKRTFDKGYDGVLYLEDDVTLSQDAVEMATWYFNHPSRNDFLCLNLYNHESLGEGDPGALFAGDKFSALGIGITAEQWKTHFEPSWWKDPRGWDYCFSSMISDGLKVLQPRVSRSKHIGRFGGVHYRANLHDKLYVDNVMWEGKTLPYHIEDKNVQTG
jgi:hypothetical protein